MPGEEANPTRAPPENASTEQRTEEAGNGVLGNLQTSPDSSEDKMPK
jgi:hypothetical protein